MASSIGPLSEVGAVDADSCLHAAARDLGAAVELADLARRARQAHEHAGALAITLGGTGVVTGPGGAALPQGRHDPEALAAIAADLVELDNHVFDDSLILVGANLLVLDLEVIEKIAEQAQAEMQAEAARALVALARTNGYDLVPRS